jgi:hypothetical protein
MDFTQFLQNSYSKNTETDSDKVKKNKKLKKSNNTEFTNKNIKICKNNSIQDTQNNQDTQDTQDTQDIQIQHNSNQYNLSTYKNIRKGDFVKIIKLENSELNHYKGYIGEIRDYKKDQSHALIFLHARNTNTYILFPLKHLEKYDM